VFVNILNIVTTYKYFAYKLSSMNKFTVHIFIVKNFNIRFLQS